MVSIAGTKVGHHFGDLLNVTGSDERDMPPIRLPTGCDSVIDLDDAGWFTITEAVHHGPIAQANGLVRAMLEYDQRIGTVALVGRLGTDAAFHVENVNRIKRVPLWQAARSDHRIANQPGSLLEIDDLGFVVSTQDPPRFVRILCELVQITVHVGHALIVWRIELHPICQ